MTREDLYPPRTLADALTYYADADFKNAIRTAKMEAKMETGKENTKSPSFLALSKIFRPVRLKILVDVIGDYELFFASGYETYNIFEFALERNQINKSKLLRYASRRNRKDKVEQILSEIEHDDTQETCLA